jgi:hypothetical protein
MVLGALEAVGGQTYLEEQALENPVAFLGLLKALIPKAVIADLEVTHLSAKAAHDEIIQLMRQGAVTIDQRGRIDVSARIICVLYPLGLFREPLIVEAGSLSHEPRYLIGRAVASNH